MPDIAAMLDFARGSRRHFVNHRDDAQQDRASDPQVTALDLLAVKRPPSGSALYGDLDVRAGRDRTRRAGVSLRDASEKTVGHQAVFYFLPYLAESCVEPFSHLLVFHDVSARDLATHDTRTVDRMEQPDRHACGT